IADGRDRPHRCVPCTFPALTSDLKWEEAYIDETSGKSARHKRPISEEKTNPVLEVFIRNPPSWSYGASRCVGISNLPSNVAALPSFLAGNFIVPKPCFLKLCF